LHSGLFIFKPFRLITNEGFLKKNGELLWRAQSSVTIKNGCFIEKNAALIEQIASLRAQRHRFPWFITKPNIQ
jgi:hypothetical protein